MLIGISGTLSSGKEEVAKFLSYQGFRHVSYGDVAPAGRDSLHFGDCDGLVDYVTAHWRDNFVFLGIYDAEFLDKVSLRPFFLHVTVDAPISVRFKRYNAKSAKSVDLATFVVLSDEITFNVLSAVIAQAHVKIVNDKPDAVQLYQSLSSLNLTDTSRLRPNWDQYFMELADLASRRSNCMKRRVGCVIVRDHRIISTGYNGTPKNLTNCNEGGCERCNKNLPTNCVCLHAEENALLESGRDRVGSNSVLYCNTCPCLQCTIKIIQTGISCVVYKNEYKFDEQSKRLLDEAGIVLRRFQPIELA